MSMINEDYVSFETAKLLKEKGFHFPIYVFIGEDGRKRFSDRREDWNDSEWDDNKTYSCPTLQMAMKWLREMKGIYITIEHGSYPSIRKHYFIPTIDSGEAYGINDEEIIQEFDTYEQACEAAIQYCLEKLI